MGRVTFSGGECTLDWNFLIDAIKYLKRIDKGVRLYMGANGSLPTSDYINELVDAGINDIGIDPKALSPVSKNAVRCLRTVR